ncbi:hypothetical protein DQM68_06645 [Leptospira mayottensis]|uniref:DUF1564 family protein n=1 Tax=Leptospira mayottensis TaxID=1137606 RepID=A0ABM6Y8M2_9LEPT|nr:hypothetical protein DQM68_06645 [Leptospira mayottensis]AXR64231.1 hypothetical protein DQM28_08350 [Leptospira mayottensis]AXR67943.1 hypothetical protein DPV73_07855 [Leptospira mayottensis]AZQ03155.1 hypothetical protein LEP1GSC190_15045 [Leptospira mayottensis 200901116]
MKNIIFDIKNLSNFHLLRIPFNGFDQFFLAFLKKHEILSEGTSCLFVVSHKCLSYRRTP